MERPKKVKGAWQGGWIWSPKVAGDSARECDPSGKGDHVRMRPKVAGLTQEGAEPEWQGGAKGRAHQRWGWHVREEKEKTRE